MTTREVRRRRQRESALSRRWHNVYGTRLPWRYTLEYWFQHQDDPRWHHHVLTVRHQVREGVVYPTILAFFEDGQPVPPERWPSRPDGAMPETGSIDEVTILAGLPVSLPKRGAA